MEAKGKENMSMEQKEEAVEIVGRGRGRPPKALSLVPVRDLADRARVINQYYENARLSAMQMSGWIAMGGLELIAARDMCDHGEFEKWVDQNFEFEHTTAYKHIALAQEIKKRLDTAEDCEQFLWLLERAPSTLDEKQRTRLFNLMAPIIQGRNVTQLYFDFGITKRKELPAVEKPAAGPGKTVEEYAIRDVNKFWPSFDALFAKAHVYAKLPTPLLTSVLNGMEQAVYRMREELKGRK